MNNKFLSWIIYDVLMQGSWVFALLLLFFLFALSISIFEELAKWKDITVFIAIWPIFLFAFFPLKFIIKELYKFWMYWINKKENEWKIYSGDSISKLNVRLIEMKKFLEKIDKNKNPNFYEKENKKIIEIEANIDTYIKFNEIKYSILKSKENKKNSIK